MAADFKPSEAMWKELYDALRAEVGPKTEMTKKSFVKITLAWLLKYHPHKAWIKKHEKLVVKHLGMIFDKYLDTDHNGTVSAKELETAIAKHKKSRGK